MDLLRVKPVEATSEENPLRPELGGFQLTLLGIGCIVGTGIFVITGTAAAQHAGPAIVLSFLLKISSVLEIECNSSEHTFSPFKPKFLFNLTLNKKTIN